MPRTSTSPAGLRAFLALPILLLLMGAGATAGEEGPLPSEGAAAGPFPRHLLLITFDTLRVDHLSAYGYPYDTSPAVRALAEEGVLFEDVTAQIPVTGPGHCTILTSLFPQTHGSYRNGVRMNDEAATLTEILKARGFRTGAFVSSWTLRASLTGLERGFDVYDEDMTDRYGVMNSQRFANEVTDRAISWLEELEQTEEPVFLWVHYFDPHEPYRLVPGFEEQGPAPGRENGDLPGRRKDLVRYDSEIAFADAQMSRVINAFRRRDWLDETLVVYTADHGEAFGEHGYRGHGRRVHQPGIAVPLVFRWPAGIAEGRRVPHPAALLDIAPTVLALMGLEPPAVFQGESLEPWLREGETPPTRSRNIYSVAYPGTVGHMPGFVRGIFERKRPDHPMEMALRQGGMKYVFSPKKGKARLYDLGSDPGERHSILSERAEYRSFRVRLVEWFDRTRKAEGETTLTADDLRKLESLGYVGNAHAASREPEETGVEEGPSSSVPSP